MNSLVKVLFCLLSPSTLASCSDVMRPAEASSASRIQTIDCGVPQVDDPPGSLPHGRTVTLTPCDPIPATLINEIQDQFVLDKRAVYQIPIEVRSWVSSGQIPVVVPAPSGTGIVPVWRIQSGTQLEARLTGYDVGAQVRGVSFESYGDGLVDVDLILNYFESGPGDPTGFQVARYHGVNDPAIWTNKIMPMPGGFRTLDGPSGVLLLSMGVGAGGTSYHVGNFNLILARP